MKEIRCDILKTYCITDKNEYGDTRLCEVSWNGRAVKGVDIRKYDAERESLSKGLTVSYDGLTDIVKASIEHGLVSIDDVEEYIKARREKEFDDNDFTKLFDNMNYESTNYNRDKYGMLRDDKGRYVILGRNKRRR